MPYPSRILDTSKEITGSRVLESPASYVLPERIVEGRRSNDVVSQRQKNEGRLSVTDRTKSSRIDIVRRCHQRRLRAARYGVGPVSQIPWIGTLAGVTRLIRECI